MRLIVDHVWKFFQKGGQTITALQDISLKEDSGCLVVLGLNGAGKTTLFRIILGLYVPDRGQVLVDGEDPVESPGRAAYPLLPYSDPRMTVSDAIEIIEMFFGVHVPKDLIKLLRLDDQLDVEYQKLSTGYQRRLGLLSAFSQPSDVVLLDEVTNGLDAEAVEVFVNVVNEIKRRKLVLFATHIFEHAERVMDRLFVLHRGKNIYYGDPEGFKHGKTLREAFLEAIH